MSDSDQPQDNLDAFFDAADQSDWHEMRQAAINVANTSESPNLGGFTHPAWGDAFAPKRKSLVAPEPAETPVTAPSASEQPSTLPPEAEAILPKILEASNPVPASGRGRSSTSIAVFPPPDRDKSFLTSDEEEVLLGENSKKGKFIAIDPTLIPGVTGESDRPFVLIPAHIHTFMPWWGWLTIALGLLMLITGVVLLPGVTLGRLTERLGDKNDATARAAMRQLVINGDERTVRRLYDVAASSNTGLGLRLRAVDTMSLIEQVPEVDRALLRLELSSSTHDQVREAAIAARRQREAYRTTRDIP